MKPKIIFLLVLLFALVSEAQPDSGLKTISRTDDPIVLKASRLAPVLGADPAALSLMAVKGGSWAPIPFQIDQVKPDGTYAFTSGQEMGPDPDPRLDANDELAFLARDLGDRSGGPFPPGAKAGVKIAVQDPKDNSRGWAYLIRFEGVPVPANPDDYIQLEVDLKNNRRWGRSQGMVVGAPLDRVYPDFIATPRPDGKMGADVLDRLKIRGEFILPGGFKVPFNADDLIYTRDLGYIDGPIRALQYTDGYMKFAGIELSGFGKSVVFFYPNQVICPITIAAGPQVPDWVLKLLPSGHVAGYMDFNPKVFGAHVISQANPLNLDVVLDGHMSQAEKELDRTTNIDWVAGFGPEGGIVSRLRFAGNEAKAMRLVTYFVDDPAILDPPEEFPGSCSVGFDIMGAKDGDMGSIAKSSTFNLYFYGKRDLSADNIHQFLDILDFPVKVLATPLDIKT